MLFEILEALFWGAAGAAAGAAIAYVIDKVITAYSVKETVREKCPNALKAIIMEKKENAVNVGIFDYNDQMSECIEIKSSKGVSNSLQVGQEIYMYN